MYVHCKVEKIPVVNRKPCETQATGGSDQLGRFFCVTAELKVRDDRHFLIAGGVKSFFKLV